MATLTTRNCYYTIFTGNTSILFGFDADVKSTNLILKILIFGKKSILERKESKERKTLVSILLHIKIFALYTC